MLNMPSPDVPPPRAARLLGVVDVMGHKVLDPYINATVAGRHLPAWGRLQLCQWHVCNAYLRQLGELPPR